MNYLLFEILGPELDLVNDIGGVIPTDIIPQNTCISRNYATVASQITLVSVCESPCIARRRAYVLSNNFGQTIAMFPFFQTGHIQVLHKIAARGIIHSKKDPLNRVCSC